jgi:hypothetical protein
VQPDGPGIRVQVADSDVPDFAGVSTGEGKGSRGGVAAGSCHVLGGMAQGDGFVLVQRTDPASVAVGQPNVPRGVGIGEAEFPQGPVEGAQDGAALVLCGRG